MRKIVISKLIILILCADIYSVTKSIVPEKAEVMLAESLCTSCGSVAMAKREKGIEMINQALPSGKILRSENNCHFLKTSECGENEFVSSCSMERVLYKTEYGKKIYYPLVVFMFHSEDKHLIGIEKKNLSSRSVQIEFNKIDRYVYFSSEIILIPYKYAGERTFLFDATSNKIIVHCKIISKKPFFSKLN